VSNILITDCHRLIIIEAESIYTSLWTHNVSPPIYHHLLSFTTASSR
jgi:hypothetical protein